MEKKEFYLASGWFNPAQEEARQDLLRALKETNSTYFSPKDEVVIGNMSDEEELLNAFNKDIDAIKDCNFIIASPAGRDLGTSMEIGFAASLNKPTIIYNKNDVLKNSRDPIIRNTSNLIWIADDYEELVTFITKLKQIKPKVFVAPQIDGNSSENEFNCYEDIVESLDNLDISRVNRLEDCSFVVVSTADKNIFSSSVIGQAHCKSIPIIVYFNAPENVPVNLMLACSAYRVCKNKKDLVETLKEIKDNGFKENKIVVGNVE